MAKQLTLECQRGQPHPQTSECCTWRCPHCDAEPFCSRKRLATHIVVHQERPCRWCGRMTSVKGHTQHETRCPRKGTPLVNPAWHDQVRDFLDHATTIPTGTLLVVTAGNDPAFYSINAALTRIANATTPTLVIPAHLIPPDTAGGKRYRRNR